MGKTRELNPKQARFVQEYLLDLNATQAAVRSGYSPRTAQEQSSRLLSKAMVQQALERGKADKRDELKVDSQWVLLKLFENHERAVAANQGGVVNRTLELIGRHLGFFPDAGVKVTGTDGGAIKHEHKHQITLEEFRQLPLAERIGILRAEVAVPRRN